MANKHVQQKFILEVNEVISNEKDKVILFEALKKYQASSDVRALVGDLKCVLNDPTKLEIFDCVRPLIRPQHQQQYDKMAPVAPGLRIRVIKLRRMSDSLGFAVRGGYEHGIGVFVSNVDKGSQAEQRGLKKGDEIVRVNGFTIAEAIHEEVLNLIKGRDEIELKVTNIGMLPIKESPGDPVTWQYVDKPATKTQAKSHDRNSSEPDGDEVKIFINKHGAPSLGCSIFTGPKTFPGIFIETVRPGSLAEDYRLEVGDQIMQVNNKSFLDIKHKEAIVELMGTKELNMVIKKGVGLPLLNVGTKKRRAPDPPGTVKATSMHEDNDSGEIICEILEDDGISRDDKRDWEMLHQDFQQIKEEEMRKITFKEKEETQRKEEERQRVEEMRKITLKEKEKTQRKEEERQRAAEEERRKTEEERRQKERQVKEQSRKTAQEAEIKLQEEILSKKLKQKLKEKDFYRRVRFHQRQTEREKQSYFLKRQLELEELRELKSRSSVLTGRLAPTSHSMKPTLLGAADRTSTTAPVVKEVVIRKNEDVPLDMELEGGIGSPLGGKIVVADVFYGGMVDKSGEIMQGDEVLKIDGKSLVNITLEKAQKILADAEKSQSVLIRFTVVESELRNEADEMTYF